MALAKGGKPEVLHPSVEKLLADHPEETNPEQLIRELARKRVAYAKGHGWTGPFFCPILLASLSNVICNEVHHDIGGDGRIILDRRGRPVIEYRSGRLHERQRFTVFHEFAHLLFTDYCRFVPHHHNPNDHDSPEHRHFENLCDIAAAEMMMPQEDFRADVGNYSQLNSDALIKLATRYVASIDATISRCSELAGHLSFSAAFLTDQRGSYPGTGPLWVRYSKKTSTFRGFIWPGTSPPTDSVVLRCLRTGSNVAPAHERWLVKGRQVSYEVEAIKLPDVPTEPNYPKVVALFRGN